MKQLGGLETTYNNVFLRMRILKYNINQIYQKGINTDNLNKNFAYFRDDFNKICNNKFAYDALENRLLVIELKKSLAKIMSEFKEINKKAEKNSYVSLLSRDGETVTFGIHYDLIELGIIGAKEQKVEIER